MGIKKLDSHAIFVPFGWSPSDHTQRYLLKMTNLSINKLDKLALAFVIHANKKHKKYDNIELGYINFVYYCIRTGWNM